MGDEENHRDVAGSTFMERQRSDIFSNVHYHRQENSITAMVCCFHLPMLGNLRLHIPELGLVQCSLFRRKISNASSASKV